MGRSAKKRLTRKPTQNGKNTVEKKKERDAATSSSSQLVPLPLTSPNRSALELLDLPPEIFKQIVHELILEAGPKKAWLLRETCRGTFASEISHDLFAKQQKQILETFWNKNRAKAMTRGFDQYLFNRVKNPLDLESHLPKKIQAMAEYLFEELEVRGLSQQDNLLMKLCQEFIHLFAYSTNCRDHIIDAMYGNRLPWKEPVTWYDVIRQPFTSLDKLGAALATRSAHLIAPLLTQLSVDDVSGAWFNALSIAAHINDLSLLKTIFQSLEALGLNKRCNLTLKKQFLEERHSAFCLSTAISFSAGPRGKHIDSEIILALLDFQGKHLRLPNNSHFSKWLKQSLYSQRPDIFEAMLRMPRYKSWNGASTLFKEACGCKDRIYVDLILDHAKEGLENKNITWSPIFIAIRSGSLPSVTAILERNPEAAEIKVRSNHQQSVLAGKIIGPIDLATYKENMPLIECLLEFGSPLPNLAFWPKEKSAYVKITRMVERLKGDETEVPDYKDFRKMGAHDLQHWDFAEGSLEHYFAEKTLSQPS